MADVYNTLTSHTVLDTVLVTSKTREMLVYLDVTDIKASEEGK